MKRAATYVRMSTDLQDESPERQRSQILPYCEQKQFVVVREYSDLGLRGWDSSRPGFQQLLSDAKAGEFEVIVVDELSRLSRQDPVDFTADVVKPLRQAGVQLHTVADGLVNWNDIVGQIMLAIRQDKAFQESPTLARRCMTQYVRMAAAGRLFPGKPPYGYRHVKDAEGRRCGLAFGPEIEVATVRLIFDWYVNRDKSLRDVTRELYVRGVPSPAGHSQWSAEAVRLILLNRVYCGDYIYNRTRHGKFVACERGEVVSADEKRCRTRNPESDWIVVPDAFDPLVSRDDYQRAQDRLNDNRGRSTPRPDRGGFILSRLLVCGHCGAYMIGACHRRTTGKWAHNRYRCLTRGKFNGLCDNGLYIREADLLRHIFHTLRETILSPTALDRYVADAKARQLEAADPSQVMALQAEIGRLDKLIEQGEEKLVFLPRELCGPLVETLRAWRAARSRHLSALQSVPARPPVEDAERMWGTRDVLDRGDPEKVRVFLREIVSRVEIWAEPAYRGRQARFRLTRGLLHTHDQDLLSLLLEVT